MAEVVVPLCLAKAGFLSGCTVVLGIVAARRIYIRFELNIIKTKKNKNLSSLLMIKGVSI
jgi:hypothetical protein